MKKKQTTSIPDRSRPGSTTTARPTDVQGGREKLATATPLRLTRETTIGTWNVRTLYACGKVKELTHELLDTDGTS